MHDYEALANDIFDCETNVMRYENEESKILEKIQRIENTLQDARGDLIKTQTNLKSAKTNLTKSLGHLRIAVLEDKKPRSKVLFPEDSEN